MTRLPRPRGPRRTAAFIAGAVAAALAAAMLAGIGAGAAGTRPSFTHPARGGDIRVTPVLHASLQIAHAGTVIQVDPWSAADLSTLDAADLILVTDDPGHHLDPAAIARLRKPTATVILPSNADGRIPGARVMRNGDSLTVGAVRVEAVAAYDLTPGEPAHPKGEANGYVLTLGGRRLYLAGVTECVPEVRALRRVDVAFMPLNIPPGRMAPAAAAACTRALRPGTVYVYHYDQGEASRIGNTAPPAGWLPDGLTVPASLRAFEDALAGSGITVRMTDWYRR